MAVLQNGNVSPGHSTIWVANGVIGDGGPFPAGPRVLGSAFGASFNTTTDQPILIPTTVSAWALTGIMVTNASINLTSAVGGFYTQPSKGGIALVSASQNYIGLTAPSVLLQLLLTGAGAGTRLSPANVSLIGTQMAVFFSLTMAQGTTATADIYLLGVDLSA